MPKSSISQVFDIHMEYSDFIMRNPCFQTIRDKAMQFSLELNSAYQTIKPDHKPLPEHSPIRVIVGGSLAYKMVANAPLDKIHDFDFYEVHDYPFPNLQADYEKVRLNACSLLVGQFIAKGATVVSLMDPQYGYVNAQYQGHDYNLLTKTEGSTKAPYQVFSNFQAGVCPFTGALIFDKSLDAYENEHKHQKDFDNFHKHGRIVSYHLESLTKEALNHTQGFNQALSKLAFILKSYIDPLNDGKIFEVNTARHLKGLLETESLKQPLRDRLLAAYGPQSNNPRFADAEAVERYLNQLKRSVDRRAKWGSDLGVELTKANMAVADLKKLNHGLLDRIQEQKTMDQLNDPTRSREYMELNQNHLELQHIHLMTDALYEAGQQTIADQERRLKQEQLEQQDLLLKNQAQALEIERLMKLLAEKEAALAAVPVVTVPAEEAPVYIKLPEHSEEAPIHVKLPKEDDSDDEQEDEAVSQEKSTKKKRKKKKKKAVAAGATVETAAVVQPPEEAIIPPPAMAMPQAPTLSHYEMSVLAWEKEAINKWCTLVQGIKRCDTWPDGKPGRDIYSYSLKQRSKEMHQSMMKLIAKNQDKNLNAMDQYKANIANYFELCDRLTGSQSDRFYIHDVLVADLAQVLHEALLFDKPIEMSKEQLRSYIELQTFMTDPMRELFPTNLILKHNPVECLLVLLDAQIARTKTRQNLDENIDEVTFKETREETLKRLSAFRAVVFEIVNPKIVNPSEGPKFTREMQKKNFDALTAKLLKKEITTEDYMRKVIKILRIDLTVPYNQKAPVFIPMNQDVMRTFVEFYKDCDPKGGEVVANQLLTQVSHLLTGASVAMTQSTSARPLYDMTQKGAPALKPVDLNQRSSSTLMQ